MRLPFTTALLAAVLASLSPASIAQSQADSPVARSAIAGGVTIVPEDIVAKGLRATGLLAAGIYNGRSDRLGQVQELIASQDKGELKVVLIETGGFLGINSRRLAIPVDRFAALGTQLVLPDATEDSLRQMPETDDQSYADLGDIRLSQLLEANVYNADNEELGEVVDLVISETGVITVVIIDVGGILGLNAHRLAIPLQQFTGLDRRMVLPRATRAILRDLPAFQGG